MISDGHFSEGMRVVIKRGLCGYDYETVRGYCGDDGPFRVVNVNRWSPLTASERGAFDVLTIVRCDDASATQLEVSSYWFDPVG